MNTLLVSHSRTWDFLKKKQQLRFKICVQEGTWSSLIPISSIRAEMYVGFSAFSLASS